MRSLNHQSTAAIRLVSNYFDYWLSLDTPTYTVAQMAERFEPSTVLCSFYTVQPSSLMTVFLVQGCSKFGLSILPVVLCFRRDTLGFMISSAFNASILLGGRHEMQLVFLICRKLDVFVS